jgi:hypothetical protein
MVYRNSYYILFLLLTVANIYIFLNRRDYEYVQQAGYKQLYPTISKGIRHLTVEQNNQCTLDLNGYAPSVKWAIYCNDSVLKTAQTAPLHFTLLTHVNRYTLYSDAPTMDSIIIDLDYSPAYLYQSNSSSFDTNYEIRYSSVPFINTDSTAILKWKDPFSYIDKTELETVQQIIRDTLKLNDADSTVTKIKKISEYIRLAIKNNMGVPADSLQRYSIYRQFCLARDNKARLWCGNITDIFHLFATNAGIICRNIGIAGNYNRFYLGNHSLNECYLPETGEWALVDLTQNIILPHNTLGNYLNTVDMYQLKRLQQTETIRSYAIEEKGVTETSFIHPDKSYIWRENSLLFPYPYNPATLYSLSNKIKRYLLPRAWLEVYNENEQTDNRLFYLKIFLFYSWLLLGILIVVLSLLNKTKKA